MIVSTCPRTGLATARWRLMLALLAGEVAAPIEPAQPGPRRRHRASNAPPEAWAGIDRAACLVLDADLSLDLSAGLPTVAELTAGDPLAPAQPARGFCGL